MSGKLRFRISNYIHLEKRSCEMIKNIKKLGIFV